MLHTTSTPIQPIELKSHVAQIIDNPNLILALKSTGIIKDHVNTSGVLVTLCLFLESGRSFAPKMQQAAHDTQVFLFVNKTELLICHPRSVPTPPQASQFISRGSLQTLP